MARKQRALSPFSLSFLDIMSCGFGAVVLLFLIIKHNVDANIASPVTASGGQSEVSLLEEEILLGKKNLAVLRNTISEINKQLVEAQGRAERITEKIKSTEGLTKELINATDKGKLDKLKTEIKQLEIQRDQLKKKLTESGEDTRKIAGDGDRAYVTGLKLGGQRMLILLDISASMLDDSLVNIIRRRNMRDERKRNAPKWDRALSTVEWLSAKFPQQAQYQIYTFNTDTNSILPETKGKWLDVHDKLQLNQAIANLDKIVPEKGTNLEQAFITIKGLRPLPDNVYLITDGLPTLGSKSSRATTITGRERLSLFNIAVKSLPNNVVPMNIILAPLEGDPEAANAFWELAQITNGSFMSPSRDWP